MRSHILTLSLRFIPLLLLAGCSANLQELRNVAPVATDFPSSLATEYLAYSESEAEQGRKSTAEYFASKGLRASKGEAVEPDAVNTKLNAKEKTYKALSASRLAFMDILNDNIKKNVPQDAARVQILFDCWNSQEGNKITITGASCAEEFSLAYDELQSMADEIIHGDDGQYTIDFDADSALLSAEAKDVVSEIAKHIKGHSDYALELNGYHDINDNKTSQGRLVKNRLSNVRGALLKAGVPKDKIFFAKTKPAGASGAAVYLSSDEIMQDSDVVDITFTSLRHALVGGQ